MPHHLPAIVLRLWASYTASTWDFGNFKMKRSVTTCFALFLALLVNNAESFYLPGVAPMDFRKASRMGQDLHWESRHRRMHFDSSNYLQIRGFIFITAVLFHPQKDLIGLKVNKLSSVKNVLPYEYYSLPYCRPEKIEQSAENLGEVLRGDRIENSLYQIQMRVDEQCKVLCRITALTTAQAKAFRTKIDDDYRVNM